MLAADFRCQGHALVRKVLQEKANRAFRTNRSDLAREFRRRGELVAVRSRGGIYLGDLPGVNLDEKRLNRIFQRMVQGLNWYVREVRLPDDTCYDVRRNNIILDRSDWENFNKIEWHGTGHIGTGEVFHCAYRFGERDGESLWLLVFYSRLVVKVATARGERPPW
jgi:hypothetical protein